MSFGKTVDGIVDHRRPECTIPRSYLNEIVKIYWEEYFLPLSLLDGVIVVQAAANAAGHLEALNLVEENKGRRTHGLRRAA